MRSVAIRRWARAGALLLALLASATAAAAGRTQTERELAAVQERIRSLQQEISRDAARKPTAGKALKQAEVAESEARAQLREVRRQLAQGRERERELRAEIARTETDLAGQRGMLERQLRLAWVTGREEWLRLALTQQDPVALSRRVVYYGYVTRERSVLMEQVRNRLATLAATAAELERELAALADLGRRQEARVREVSAARQARARAVRTLARDLGSRQQKLTRLRREARSLQDLMTRLARESRPAPRRPAEAPRPGSGPALPAGREIRELPLHGRTVASFGQPRADGLLRWDGLVLAAPAGTEVRAVRAGRVVYADWLPGMGQLLVVDHGGGYMSLYGHNQELLKAAGQDVRQGEAIARVGDSGGQGSPGLYFEVRRNGKPVDPRGWVR
ncbi:MAG: peptidoglycan DD-metalloendopeptidase family protein [Gammaproteobacteria bacterium]|nr:peptidoglycan DD-metalloendopeptidase family protein [Gammaproteobacteria bacterium]